jgi:hypothetical protein
MSRQDKALKTRTFSQHSKQNSIQQKQVSGFEAHLDKVDEIGSQLFGAGLLVACHIMSLLAALTLVMVGLHALSFVEDIHPALALIGAAIFFIHFLCLYIFLLDTFSNGLLSKRKSGIVNKPMYLIYRVQRLLNGYFLYEKIHLRLRNTKITLLSNLFFLILIVGFVVYLIVAVVEGFNHAQNSHHEQNTVTQEEVEQDNFFRTFYLSNYQQNGLISAISLSQPEYSNMPVKLFIPLFAQMQSMIDDHCEANAFAEPEDEVNLPCIQDFFTIQVNGNELDVEAIAGRHADSRTKGINYYIDLPELARGKHEITVVIDNPDFKEADETEEREPEHLETQLDFWYFPTK